MTRQQLRSLRREPQSIAELVLRTDKASSLARTGPIRLASCTVSLVNSRLFAAALGVLAAPLLLMAQDAGISLIDSPEKAKAAQAAWAAKLGKPAQWANSVGMKFQLIPPGEFDMGVKDGEKDAPLRRVKLT